MHASPLLHRWLRRACPRIHAVRRAAVVKVVEGLALAGVRAGDYDLIVLPMKVAGHEGAPARAVMRKRAP